MEVETAIARTSRSPMIRDAHDFRAGIHDRLLRKLTGRSYSALVHPVARDFPLEEMRPGDVFFHNDVYRSEGGIGHLPDLCVTVPVFSGGRGRRVRPGVRPPRRHRRRRARLDAERRDHASSRRGSWSRRSSSGTRACRTVRRSAIMTRNSRMPESLAADLDAECSACLMGARRLGELFDRYGRDAVEACFDAIIDRTTQTYRREILAKIPVGSWVWEDYAEHDGVDAPQLHAQRITLTRTAADDPDGERLVLDFDGTSPQAKGPINHCGDYSDGVFLKKWLAPILRNLADTPGADGRARRQRGRRTADRDAVPAARNPADAGVPGTDQRADLRDPAAARGAGRRAGEGGRRAGCRPTRRRSATPGVYGEDMDGRPYLMREVLGGGSGGRSYADGEDTIHVVPDSRNLPTEFTESRFPFLVEKLSLAMDSGGPGKHRGGLGYEKHIRMLKDGHFMSIADRSILACWGVERRPGRPALLGGDRPRRPERAGGRRARGRRAGPGRRDDPDPDDRRWRLGRPVGARPGARRPRRPLAQSVPGGCPRRLRCRSHRLAWTATTSGTTPRRPRPCGGSWSRAAATGRSSTAGPGFRQLSGGRESAEVDWL